MTSDKPKNELAPNATMENGRSGEASHVYFRLVFQVRGARLNFQRNEFTFEFKDSLLLEVSLRAPGPDFPEVMQSEDAICRVDLVKEPDATVRSLLERLAHKELPDGYDLPFPAPPIVNEKGEPTRVMPQLVFMPKPFQAFVHEFYPRMREAAMRVLDLLRWRFNRHGASFSQILNGFRFSFDNQDWHDMPSLIDPTAARVIDSFTHESFGEHEASALRMELQWGSSEPLAHELFREAWHLRSLNPKSSLLIGFSAAEVGTKNHIARVLEFAKDFVMKMSSPPIRELLHFINNIPHSVAPLGEGKRIPPSIRRALHQMSELRNKIAHTGEHDPDAKREAEKLTWDSLEEKLQAVRDLLWLLDYYSGHLWAVKYVSSDRMREIADAKE